MRIDGLIHNLYEVSRQLFIPVIQQFILKNHVRHYFSTNAEDSDSSNACPKELVDGPIHGKVYPKHPLMLSVITRSYAAVRNIYPIQPYPERISD